MSDVGKAMDRSFRRGMIVGAAIVWSAYAAVKLLGWA